VSSRSIPLGLLVASLGLASGSCGYSTSSGVLASHLKTVAIPVFENETTEYALEQELTTVIIRRFVADNHLRVVDERGANSIIQGRITVYRNSVFGISSEVARAQEYRVTIGVAVVFRDQVKNREIWNDEIVKTANYYVEAVPGDSARTELDGRKTALDRIADEILSRTVESW
jgi:hypothetical protein